MSELAWPLRFAMFHFGSGDALFLGCFLLFVAARAEAWNWPRRWVTWCGWLGFVWIALSAWPAMVIQAALLSAGLIWLARDWWPKSRWSPNWVVCRRIVVAALLIAMISEWRYQRPLRLNLPNTPHIAVLGDSVTAGLERNDRTWPQQAAQRFGWTVFDASQQGATVKSALRQLDALDGRGEVLIVEIGGNDVLEGVPVHKFTHELDSLLQSAHTRYRTVLMCELPLPPLANRYGAEQRRLAARHSVRLIPKRELIGVLTSGGGTVDGVHLSNAGQTKLAEVMQRVIGAKPSSTPGEYRRSESMRSRS
jgi:acyl-CoA thioesterase-1